MITALKYALFAGIATLGNLFFQYLSLKIYSGNFSLYIAMFAGTGVGLVIKFLLDKNFIFYHKANSKREDAKNFVVYTFTGVFTTLIFWGMEISFHYFWNWQGAKYFGAVIGLSIGYIVKYFLDKHYVFKEQE